MKTTLNIDDFVMAQLKQEALKQGRTMSELVESALRLLFRAEKTKRPLPSLPSFKSGGYLVDLADRDALYQMLISIDSRFWRLSTPWPSLDLHLASNLL